jgi:CHAT domain-containing protein
MTGSSWVRAAALAGLLVMGTGAPAQERGDFDVDRALSELAEPLLPGRHIVDFAPGEPRSPAEIDQARRLLGQARQLDRAGQYLQAVPLYAQALDVLQALGPLSASDPGPTVEASLNRLAALRTVLGEHAAAEQLYRRIMERWRWRFPRLPHLVNVLNHRSLQFPDLAKDCASVDLSDSLVGLAALYTATGAFAKAESLLVQARVVARTAAGDPHPALARALQGLGLLHLERGAPQQARPLLEQALALRQQTLGPDHEDTGRSLLDLARLHADLGDASQAERLFRQGLSVLEVALGSGHADLADGLSRLASLDPGHGPSVEAFGLHHRARVLLQRALGQDNPAEAVLLRRQALLHWRLGQMAQALPLLARARELEERGTVQMLRTATEERRLHHLGQLRPDAEVSFSLADPSVEAQALGATAVLQAKGRVLDATAQVQTLLRRDADPISGRLRLALQRIAQRRAEATIDGLDPLSVPGRGEWNYYNDAIRDMLEEMLLSRMEGQLQHLRPVLLSPVQAAIDPSDVLIEWIRFQPVDPKHPTASRLDTPARFAACLIFRDRAPVMLDLGSASAIEQSAQALRQQLIRPTGTVRPAEARDLHRLVLQPVLDRLSSLQHRPSRLLLSPDGVLNQIPLAVLLDEQGQFLADSFELAYLDSGRDLTRLQSQTRLSHTMTVFANPDYDFWNTDEIRHRGWQHKNAADEARNRALKFGPLAGTEIEARLLTRLFQLGPDQVAIGPRATEQRLKQQSPPGILHIATHGFALGSLPMIDGMKLLDRNAPVSPGLGAPPSRPVNVSQRRVEIDDSRARQAAGAAPENPLLRAGLALASANHGIADGNEDGILTALEAAQLDLQGTQLVVLSACETGTGEERDGEGVYGMRRALALAGARSQMVSLWTVDDAATVRLMEGYYRRLQQGEGRAQALRSTQAEMRSRPETAHPFYWAPFIAVGDWRPIEWKP